MNTNLGQVELVKDIKPDTQEEFAFFSGSNPSRLTEFQGRLYFSADDGEIGSELWVSDGTTNGTQLLLDINQNISNGYAYGSFAKYFTEFDDRLYFTASDGVNGNKLWMTDGTTEGTQALSNIRPDLRDGFIEAESSVNNLIAFDNRLFFTANDSASGKELWATDGTKRGTQLVADINPRMGDDYYYAYEPVSNSSDPVNLEIAGDRLYFAANDGVNGRELWVSDGTTEGTRLVRDIALGVGEESYSSSQSLSSNPAYLTEFQGKLYFSAEDSQGDRELWVTDGTESGTQLVKDINPEVDATGYVYSSDPRDFIQLGNKLYFSARGSETDRELWVTDGTESGTQLVKDINQVETDSAEPFFSESNSFPGYFAEFENRLYFTADDGITGNELWVSDGTSEETKLVKDINPDVFDDGDFSFPKGSNISNLTEFAGKLYFAADDGVNGNELWVTDGTTEGTILVEDLNPGFTEPNFPEDFAYADSTSYISYLTFVSELTVVGDELFFSADNGDTGTELFKLTANDLNSQAEIDKKKEAIAIEGSVSLTLLSDRDNDSLFEGEFELHTLKDEAGNDIVRLQIENDGDTIVDFSLGSDTLPPTDLHLTGANILAGLKESVNYNGIEHLSLAVSDFEVI